MRRSFEGSTMIAFLKRYWRRIAVGLLFGWALLPLTQLLRPGAVGRGSAVIEAAINLVLVGSQTFWIGRAGALGAKIVTGRTWRVALGSIGLVIYIVLLTYNLRNWEDVSKGSTFSVRAALLEAPMRVWLFGSLLGFLLIAGRSERRADRGFFP
jgi:hypothetical protein